MKKNISHIFLFFLTVSLLHSCKNGNEKNTFVLKGTINDYKKTNINLFEITQSQNYFISKIEVADDGTFELKFEAKEKSVFGIKYGENNVYFINDVEEVSIETSLNEFENYFVENSLESEQLKQLIIAYKKLASDTKLSEKILMNKIVNSHKKFGNDPELIDLENRADKNSLETKNFVMNYIDTTKNNLMAIAASSFLLMNEDYNYLNLLSKKLENKDVSFRQKNDLKIEIEKQKENFKSILSIKKIKGIDINQKTKELDSLNGKYIFVNIWATWCYYSKNQMPFVYKAYQKYKDNSQVEFVNVAIDDNLKDWQNFLTNESYQMKNNLCDTLGKNAAILKRFGLEYIPANFLLDKQGNIITSNMKDDAIIFAIDSVLKQK